MSLFYGSGIISTGNSSTALLAGGATFTGTAEQNDLPDVMVAVKSDTNGTLTCEFSTDGTNWDSVLTFQYDTARINPPHIFVKGSRYFRCTFTNDAAGAQTVFRLQTNYGNFQKLTAPINGTLAENYDAIVARTTDYHHEVAMGKRQGRKTIHAFAHNTIATAGTELMANFGGTYAIMTSADTLNVVSTSINDDVGQSGCQSIIIEGIDENNLFQTETVAMDGTTPVTTSNQWLGVNKMYTVSGVCAGNITATDTAGTVGTQCRIEAGDGVSQQCVYHTQINHKFLIDDWFATARKDSGGGSPKTTFRLLSYSRVTGATYEIGRIEIDTQSATSAARNFKNPLVIGGREVLYVTFQTDTNNTPGTSRFDGIEERIS